MCQESETFRMQAGSTMQGRCRKSPNVDKLTAFLVTHSSQVGVHCRHQEWILHFGDQTVRKFDPRNQSSMEAPKYFAEKCFVLMRFVGKRHDPCTLTKIRRNRHNFALHCEPSLWRFFNAPKHQPYSATKVFKTCPCSCKTEDEAFLSSTKPDLLFYIDCLCAKQKSSLITQQHCVFVTFPLGRFSICVMTQFQFEGTQCMHVPCIAENNSALYVNQNKVHVHRTFQLLYIPHAIEM